MNATMSSTDTLIDMDTDAHVLDSVRDYYGRVLASSADLKTSACCTSESIPEHHKPIVGRIHPEVLERFYGCGSPIPHELEGRTVLDLGCGTGRDAYLLSALVGPNGRVIGVDMTPEQLEVARRHQTFHAEQWGHPESNVDFREGLIEDLAAIGVEDESVDVVVSNCVVNLSPDKERVFREIFRVLKPGGELYFSDVFSGRRVPAALQRDPVLLGECLGGAIYTEDFRRLLRGLGILDHRVVARAPLDLRSTEVEARAGMIPFESITVRAFKLTLEDLCEDYGQVAVYGGTIPEAPHACRLADHHLFRTGMPLLVCGNTAAMLRDTRFGRHFRIVGDRSVHYGPFACGPAANLSNTEPAAGGACC